MPRTLAKVCGLSTPETVDAAVAAGADYIGLNLYPPSPRYVDPASAAALRARIPSSTRVAIVVVDMAASDLLAAVEAIRPDVVQYHGSEEPGVIASVARETGIEAWRAIGVRDRSSLDDAARFRGAVARLLYDSAPGVLPGGNGLALDWSLLAAFRHTLDWGLAGGLTPANVREAIGATRAPLVDASSGLESARGIKDPALIRAFVEAAHCA